MIFDPTNHPHRRLNPLTGDYVLVSPHRMKRPWQGSQEQPAPEQRPQYDHSCYLCPGNSRVGGEKNPDYDSTFVFTNDFQALLPDVPVSSPSDNPLMYAESVRGTCRVICFSPRHDLTLAQMPRTEIRTVIGVWAEQTAELGATYQWVQVFENRGAAMGSSNPHPHGQVWAEDALPNEVQKEDARQSAYYEAHGSTLLADYARLEMDREERIVVQNDGWLIVVPYWGVWPFETLVMPKIPAKRITDLDEFMRDLLADALKRLLVRYDNLFHVSFPYSMGWHGAPFNGKSNDHWTLHAHFYPPLLRSATVKKFMVGYEMMGEAQRDLTAEQAAARLRDLSEVHYRERT
jgi:UDPglucose--hexose-1-phosphate uridylyltransferase